MFEFVRVEDFGARSCKHRIHKLLCRHLSMLTIEHLQAVIHGTEASDPRTSVLPQRPCTMCNVHLARKGRQWVLYRDHSVATLKPSMISTIFAMKRRLLFSPVEAGLKGKLRCSLRCQTRIAHTGHFYQSQSLYGCRIFDTPMSETNTVGPCWTTKSIPWRSKV